MENDDGLSKVFAYRGLKACHFHESDLREMLAPSPVPGLAAQGRVERGDDSYEFTLKKDEAGLTLDATLKRNGFEYRTAMTAALVRPGADSLYEIQSLVFDNHKERLDRRWEITKVLAHIGSVQLAKACAGEIPDAHAEKGKFGRFRRFLTRQLPDDPSTFAFMPPF